MIYVLINKIINLLFRWSQVNEWVNISWSSLWNWVEHFLEFPMKLSWTFLGVPYETELNFSWSSLWNWVEHFLEFPMKLSWTFLGVPYETILTIITSMYSSFSGYKRLAKRISDLTSYICRTHGVSPKYV